MQCVPVMSEADDQLANVMRSNAKAGIEQQRISSPAVYVNKSSSGLSDQRRSRTRHSIWSGIKTRKVRGGGKGGENGGRQIEKGKGRGLAGQRGACERQMLVKNLAQRGRYKEEQQQGTRKDSSRIKKGNLNDDAVNNSKRVQTCKVQVPERGVAWGSHQPCCTQLLTYPSLHTLLKPWPQIERRWHTQLMR